VVAQIRSLSLRARYAIMGALFAAMGILRLRQGGAQLNLILGGIILVIAVTYFIRAARSGS